MPTMWSGPRYTSGPLSITFRARMGTRPRQAVPIGRNTYIPNTNNENFSLAFGPILKREIGADNGLNRFDALGAVNGLVVKGIGF